MNNYENAIKCLKDIDRWEIVAKDSTYPYVMNHSLTVLDIKTNAKFEVYRCGNDCVIYYYGVLAFAEPDVINEFVEALYKNVKDVKKIELDDLYVNTKLDKPKDACDFKFTYSWDHIISNASSGHFEFIHNEDTYKRDRNGLMYYDLICRFYPNV